MNRALVRLRNLLLGKPGIALATGTVVLVLIALLEYLVPNTIEADLLYFLPIFIVTWYHSRAAGVLVSVAGTAVWLTDERIFFPDFMTHIQVHAWNAIIRFGTFLLFVLLLAKIKDLLAQEKRASALKSQLIRIVSHEFNNALISSQASLYLLRNSERGQPREARAQYYELLDATYKKLAIYVKNILNEARMEDGRFKVEKTELALRDIVEETADSLSDLLRQRGLTLIRVLPAIRVLVCADREALALVISNLLGNAVKFTPSGGRITVRIALLGSPSGKVKLEVEDTGPGISADDIKRIASGFTRAAEVKGATAGFGMGLKISSELLALHGSRLKIESDVGRGARFSFELDVLSGTCQ